MALGWSTALATAWLECLGNGGTTQTFFNSAILEIRSGTRPADADTAPTGTLLASMTLPADAMAAASGHSLGKSGTWQDASADATGTAAWGRVKLSGDAGTTNTTDKRLDFNVGTSGSDLNLDTVSITSSQPVTVTGFTLSLAA